MSYFFGSLLSLILAAGMACLPILFAAWAFSRAFQVSSYMRLLADITKELKRLNEFNEKENKV